MILIATPCGLGIAKEYCQSVIGLTQHLLHRGIDHSFLFLENESLITRARNTCVAEFLRTDFEWLFFIDADIGFDPEDFDRLWDLGKPVSVGVYKMKRDGAPYAAWIDGRLESLGEEPCRVTYAGTGFMLIHRDVLEDMIEAHPELAHVDGIGTSWALFDTMLWNGAYLSEDYTFCKRWTDMGGEIWMDPRVKLRHVGTKVYQ